MQKFIPATAVLLTLMIHSGCKTGKLMIENRSFPGYLSGNAILGKGFTGLAVYDPKKEKFLFRYNAEKFFIPASVTKLFTFYIAEKMMGDSLPAIRYCISNDTLYFSGMGDPTFLDPRFPVQPAYAFLEQSPYPLAYCPAKINEPRFGNGWAWDDYPYDYSAERSSMPVYGNMVHLEKYRLDTTLNIIPEIFRDDFDIKKDSLMSESNMIISREEGRNEFSVKYGRLDSVAERIPFITDTALIVRLLEDTLNRAIKISSFPSDCQVSDFFSQPKDSVMKLMLTESDNFIAEQTLMGISAIHFDTISTGHIIQFSLDSIFTIDKNSISWVDGSGLSRYNQFTPASVVNLLIRMRKEIPSNRLDSLLAVNGKSGTLTQILKNEKPFIFGKSGSMSHVYNLVGYMVSKSGRILIFCIMNNNFNATENEARIESAKILKYIRDKY